MLADMERAKTDYLAQHPAEVRRDSRAEATHLVPMAPTRVQPHRHRQRPDQFVYCVYGTDDSPQHSVLLAEAFHKVRKLSRTRQRAAVELFDELPNPSSLKPELFLSESDTSLVHWCCHLSSGWA